MSRPIPAVVFALVASLPTAPSGAQEERAGAGTGREERAEAESPTQLELEALVSRLPGVGRERRKVHGEWEDVPVVAELACRLRSGVDMPGSLWRKALLDTGVVRIRERWSARVPVAVSMRSPAWLGVARITMSPRTPGIAAAWCGALSRGRCGTYELWSRRAAMYQVLGPLGVGEHTLEFDVTVERGRGPNERFPPPPDDRILWSGTMSFDVAVLPTVDAAVPPASGAELDEAVRDSLSLAFHPWHIGGTKRAAALLVVDPDARRYPALRDLGLSLEVVVLHDGEPVRSVHLLASSYDPLALSNSLCGADQIAFAMIEEIPTALRREGSGRGCWSFRVIGTNEGVDQLWHASRRWAGSLEVPLQELVESERERAPDGRGAWITSPTWR